MKKISVWTLYCLFALLVITSCKKENIDTIIETEDPVTPTITDVTPPANALLDRASASSQSTEAADGLNFDCIEIIFPFNLVDNKGTTHEVANEAVFNELLSEQLDTTVYILDFEYPISVSVNDGEVVEVADNEQLGALFAECIPDGGWDELVFPAYLIDDENSCFKIVYPISLKDLEGNIISAEEEAAFIDILVEKEVYFDFPINLTDDEAVFSANNVDELFNLLFSCNEYYGDSTVWDWGEGFEYIGCFQVNFPMTVVVADGSEKVVNNHEELCELMLQGELVDYVYPLSLTSPEGNVVTANSADDLNEILAQCDLGIPVDPESDIILLFLFSQPLDTPDVNICYTINYPIELTYYNEGDTTTTTAMFNNVEEIWAIPTLYGNGITPNTGVSLVYPVDVTRQSDNRTISLKDIEEVTAIVTNCWDGF